ncbi:PREDICTED: uncharacterized protein LOC105556801 [Vollenhovia emeryi]|uniref:uncharacterized protein LOC105556801 n=1 Tax=Vollenhovia emeryi TaxID=411798 RepID=UPI0005F49EF5|nr:PREDICTED: uncharacterized protein LOC105556801 [Vollenhovia emeryi]
MPVYSEKDLAMAVSAVRDAGMSLRVAQQMYNVPFQTIRNHALGINKGHKRGPKVKLQEYEEEIKEACDTLVNMGYGLNKTDVKSLAVEVCDKANIPPFKAGLPSQKWFIGFKKRNNLSLRQPQNISAARLSMTTESVKEEFFSKLKSVLDDLIPKGLDATTIFNLDETGICTVLKSGKVLCSSGTRDVRAKKGGERGQNVTLLATVNATGTIILPPMIIFRGKSLSEEQMRNAMDGMLFAYSARSFIDSELFEMWFKRFINDIPPKRPVLLLMDGHGSHINLSVLELAFQNEITLLCFPPHTTHLFQPLDRGVFGPFKKVFSQEVDKLIRKNKKKNFGRNDICQILTPAWRKAITPNNITAGFRCSGIWPFNPNAVQLNNKKPAKSSTHPSTSASTEITVSIPEQTNQCISLNEVTQFTKTGESQVSDKNKNGKSLVFQKKRSMPVTTSKRIACCDITNKITKNVKHSNIVPQVSLSQFAWKPSEKSSLDVQDQRDSTIDIPDQFQKPVAFESPVVLSNFLCVHAPHTNCDREKKARFKETPNDKDGKDCEDDEDANTDDTLRIGYSNELESINSKINEIMDSSYESVNERLCENKSTASNSYEDKAPRW